MGDKPWNFNGLIKHQMTPLLSLQNGQVTKSNRTYTPREFPERFAKDRIRLHELSPFSKGQSNLCFPKKSNQNQNRERMSWTLYNSPLHCIVSYEVHIYQISKVAYICIHKNHVNCIWYIRRRFFPPFIYCSTWGSKLVFPSCSLS